MENTNQNKQTNKQTRTHKKKKKKNQKKQTKQNKQTLDWLVNLGAGTPELKITKLYFHSHIVKKKEKKEKDFLCAMKK